MEAFLLFSVFVIATCGLVYELIAGTLASYLLGDTVTQFSTIIGVYLFSMGVGSYLSKVFTRNLTTVFIQLELAVGIVGGSSAALLFFAFDHLGAFRIVLYGLVVAIGILVGLEIPIVMRLLSERPARPEFKDLVSQVLSLDYVGALVASLVFPVLLMPTFGLIRSALLAGIFNAAVAVWTLRVFRDEVKNPRWLAGWSVLTLVGLVAGFACAR